MIIIHTLQQDMIKKIKTKGSGFWFKNNIAFDR